MRIATCSSAPAGRTHGGIRRPRLVLDVARADVCRGQAAHAGEPVCDRPAATGRCWGLATPRWASSTTCITSPTAPRTPIPWLMCWPCSPPPRAGIRLTLLPVAYDRAGFDRPAERCSAASASRRSGAYLGTWIGCAPRSAILATASGWPHTRCAPSRASGWIHRRVRPAPRTPAAHPRRRAGGGAGGGGQMPRLHPNRAARST